MSAKQTTTISGESDRALGKRDEASLKAAFGTSPLYKPVDPTQALDDGDGSAAGSPMKAWYQNNVLDGKQTENTLFEGGVDMDYGTATDTSKTPTGGEGLPAGPYVPTTASPGDGNGANPASLPEVNPLPGHSDDLGSTTSPSDSSATQSTFTLVKPPALGSSAG